jgi:hypothetical protein
LVEPTGWKGMTSMEIEFFELEEQGRDVCGIKG